MKKFIKMVLPMLAMAGFMWTSCTDEEEEPIAIPTIEVGEPALSEDKSKAVVTITPSKETETWNWKCEEQGKSDAAFTTVNGNTETNIEIPISLDVTYTLTAYAENKTGKSKEVKKEFSFASSEVMTDLIEFEIKNVSAFSIDVDVKKNSTCAKYVVGAIKTEAYIEADFVESAINSLHPIEDYPMQPYNWADKSMVFDEAILYRGVLADKDIKESEGVCFEQGVKYTIAVYAINTAEEGKVFTKEVEIPVGTITGTTPLQLSVEKAMRSFTATVTSDAAKKVIINITEPQVRTENGTGDKFEDMTPEEIKAYLVTNGADLPHLCEGPVTKTFDDFIEPGTKYAIYAIAIDQEGKLGDVAYEVVTPAAPVYDGTGEFTSVTFDEQTDIEYLPINIQVSQNTKAVRIYHDISQRTDMIDWIMQDENSGDGMFWKEYTVEELEGLKLYIGYPGDSYYIYGVTIDNDGKFSSVTNLVEKAGKEGPAIETKAEQAAEGIDLSGNGEISKEIIKNTWTYYPADKWSPESWAYESSIKITKGANTKKVFVVFDDAVTPDEASQKTLVKESITKNETGEIELFGAIELIDENANEATDNVYGLYKYEQGKGGSGRIYVTLDNEGKFKIADYFICGYEEGDVEVK